MTATAMHDLKQRLAELTEEERLEATAYLVRLRHESPAGREEMSRIMQEMDEGKKVRLGDLAKQLGHG